MAHSLSGGHDWHAGGFGLMVCSCGATRPRTLLEVQCAVAAVKARRERAEK